MQNITLKDIEQSHTALGEMIANFKATLPSHYHIAAAVIDLAPGERYAGLVLADDGTPSRHLILLPGEAAQINWPDAVDWAQKSGGELPTPREQSLLFANLKTEFACAWYWSNTQHSPEYAFLQHFYYGNQYHDGKQFQGRARAVRRLPLSSSVL